MQFSNKIERKEVQASTLDPFLQNITKEFEGEIRNELTNEETDKKVRGMKRQGEKKKYDRDLNSELIQQNEPRGPNKQKTR